MGQRTPPSLAAHDAEWVLWAAELDIGEAAIVHPATKQIIIVSDVPSEAAWVEVLAMLVVAAGWERGSWKSVCLPLNEPNAVLVISDADERMN